MCEVTLVILHGVVLRSSYKGFYPQSFPLSIMRSTRSGNSGFPPEADRDGVVEGADVVPEALWNVEALAWLHLPHT